MSWSNMSLEDLYAVRDNKVNWGNATNQAAKDVYTLNNKNIRSGYGISENEDISLGELDKYIAAAERQQQKNNLLTNLTEKAKNNNVVEESANAVRNFQYDPSSDPAFKSYVDMYNRQGASAAKSTLNQLNAATMGRNSSYSAAATAQVQQAYAQKASEMIPTLAEQAYNKLLQRYNIDRDMDDNAWNKQLQAYQALASDETQNIVNEGYKMDNIGKNINNQAAQKELDVLDERLAIDLENGRLANINAILSNENLTYQNRISAVAAEIQETYGMPIEEAKFQAQLLANQKKTKNVGGNVSLADSWASKLNNDIASKYGKDFTALTPNGNGTYTRGNVDADYIILQIMNSPDLTEAEQSELLNAFGITDDQINTVLKDSHYR